MIEKILALLEKKEEIQLKLDKVRFERDKQIKAHKRSYERRPEWKPVDDLYKECVDQRTNIGSEIFKACRQYRQQVAPIPKELVDNIREKAESTNNRGAWLLARCATHSRENLVDTIEIDEILWDDAKEGFIEFAKEVGIKRIAVVDNSTAALGTVCTLIDNGWKVVGTYERKPYQLDERVKWLCDTYYSEAKGLLLEVA